MFTQQQIKLLWNTTITACEYQDNVHIYVLQNCYYIQACCLLNVACESNMCITQSFNIKLPLHHSDVIVAYDMNVSLKCHTVLHLCWLTVHAVLNRSWFISKLDHLHVTQNYLASLATKCLICLKGHVDIWRLLHKHNTKRHLQTNFEIYGIHSPMNRLYIFPNLICMNP